MLEQRLRNRQPGPLQGLGLVLLIALAALLFLCKGIRRIPLALIATLVLAGLVVLVEFALDRSSLGDIWLYMVYFALIFAYLCLGCSCAKRSAGI